MPKPLPIILCLGLFSPAVNAASSNPGSGEENNADAAARQRLSDLLDPQSQGSDSQGPRLIDPNQQSDESLLDTLQAQQGGPGGRRGWKSDPFNYLAGKMNNVGEGLAENRSGKNLQNEQEQIVRKMDTLIDMLKKASRQMGGKGSGQGSSRVSASPSSPAADSNLAPGPGGKGEMRDPDHSNKDWAKLPPREREKILQSRSEGFPTGYEQMLEEYYRKLAEGQSP